MKKGGKANNLIDMTGKTCGLWFVLRKDTSHDDKRRSAYWICRCACGIEKPINSQALRRGGTGSCGCDRPRRLSDARKTHGLSRTREYQCWSNMKKRCLDPTNDKFKFYGGRGITVCERWMDFTNFLADMGKSPSSKHSIDRIKNDLNYGPENCQWTTTREQHRNTRRNRWVAYKDEMRLLVDIADLESVPRWLVIAHYKKLDLEARIERYRLEKAKKNSST
jgi:hypothetical protein